MDVSRDREFLDCLARADSHGFNALARLAYSGRTELVHIVLTTAQRCYRRLVPAADVRMQLQQIVDRANGAGWWTALVLAAQQGHTDVVRLLCGACVAALALAARR
jgi:hypothetical protein